MEHYRRSSHTVYMERRAGCGCKCGPLERLFFTDAEKLRKLEEYKRDLEDELAAVTVQTERYKAEG
jgi:hypothetical protein